jgi:hypothetical protein
VGAIAAHATPFLPALPINNMERAASSLFKQKIRQFVTVIATLAELMGVRPIFPGNNLCFFTI